MADTAVMVTRANPELPAVAQNPVFLMSKVVDTPARSAATAYFQMAFSRSVALNSIGRPAYQKPGTKRAHEEMLHAAATPTGPQCSDTRNMETVIAKDANPHRNRRPGIPIDR